LPNHDPRDRSVSVRGPAQRRATGSESSAARGSGDCQIADADARTDASACARAGEWSIRPGEFRGDDGCDGRRCENRDFVRENRCVRYYVERRVGRRVCGEERGRRKRGTGRRRGRPKSHGRAGSVERKDGGGAAADAVRRCTSELLSLTRRRDLRQSDDESAPCADRPRPAGSGQPARLPSSPAPLLVRH
jgi:hypothetical protein